MWPTTNQRIPDLVAALAALALALAMAMLARADVNNFSPVVMRQWNDLNGTPATTNLVWGCYEGTELAGEAEFDLSTLAGAEVTQMRLTLPASTALPPVALAWEARYASASIGNPNADGSWASRPLAYSRTGWENAGTGTTTLTLSNPGSMPLVAGVRIYWRMTVACSGIAYYSVGGSSINSVVLEVTSGPPPPDTTNPAVAITSPAGNIITALATTALAGTASDNIGVTSVIWANSQGGSGTASGTTSWSVASLSLSEGANIITVTAYDAAGNSATATVTITRDTSLLTLPVTAGADDGVVSLTLWAPNSEPQLAFNTAQSSNEVRAIAAIDTSTIPTDRNISSLTLRVTVKNANYMGTVTGCSDAGWVVEILPWSGAITGGIFSTPETASLEVSNCPYTSTAGVREFNILPMAAAVNRAGKTYFRLRRRDGANGSVATFAAFGNVDGHIPFTVEVTTTAPSARRRLLRTQTN